MIGCLCVLISFLFSNFLPSHPDWMQILLNVVNGVSTFPFAINSLPSPFPALKTTAPKEHATLVGYKAIPQNMMVSSRKNRSQ